MSGTCLSVTTRTARKKHDCAWCKEPILPGEKYVHQIAVNDDGFWDNKWHPECDKAASKGLDCDDSFYPHDQQRGKTYEESHGYV